MQGKKKRDNAAAELKRLADEAAAGPESVEAYDEQTEGSNLLSSKDEDVIF